MSDRMSGVFFMDIIFDEATTTIGKYPTFSRDKGQVLFVSTPEGEARLSCVQGKLRNSSSHCA